MNGSMSGDILMTSGSNFILVGPNSSSHTLLVTRMLLLWIELRTYFLDSSWLGPTFVRPLPRVRVVK